MYREGVRKTKAKLQLNLSRDTMNSRKGFYRYINWKRKVKKGAISLIKTTGEQVTTYEGRLK